MDYYQEYIKYKTIYQSLKLYHQGGKKHRDKQPSSNNDDELMKLYENFKKLSPNSKYTFEIFSKLFKINNKVNSKNNLWVSDVIFKNNNYNKLGFGSIDSFKLKNLDDLHKIGEIYLDSVAVGRFHHNDLSSIYNNVKNIPKLKSGKYIVYNLLDSLIIVHKDENVKNLKEWEKWIWRNSGIFDDANNPFHGIVDYKFVKKNVNNKYLDGLSTCWGEWKSPWLNINMFMDIFVPNVDDYDEPMDALSDITCKAPTGIPDKLKNKRFGVVMRDDIGDKYGLNTDYFTSGNKLLILNRKLQLVFKDYIKDNYDVELDKLWNRKIDELKD